MPLSDSSDLRKPGAEAAPATTPGAASTTENAIIARMRRVVEAKQSALIGGISVDFLTARTVLRVYDRLPERKREKFDRLSAKQMVHKAFESDK
jgi:hypothetical protein